MSSPFLSFILPTIRSIGSVGDILFDIFNCDYKNMEIIIIYDSPQNSSDHIKRFIADNNRNNVAVKIIENKKNLGPGESRNIGIEASKGEYLCFIDDDDNLSLDWLGDLLVKSERPDIIFLSFEDSIGALDNNDFLKNFNSYSLYSSRYIIKKIVDGEFYPWQCQPYFYNSNFIRSNKLWFPSTYVAEDIAFNALAISTSETIEIIDSQFYLYNSRPGTLKSSGGYDRVIDCMFSYFYVFTYAKESTLGSSIEKNLSLIRLSLKFLRFFIFIRTLALSKYLLSRSGPILNDLLNLINNDRSRTQSFYSFQIKEFYKDEMDLNIGGSIRSVYSQICNIIAPKMKFMVSDVDKIYIYCAGPFGLSMARLLNDKFKINNVSFIDDNANLFPNNKIEEFKINTLENVAKTHENGIISIIVCNPQPWIEEKIIKKINNFLSPSELQFFNIYSGISVLFSD